jgi:hypothetical protein
MRRAADGVNQAIKDLEHCRTYKKVGDNTPACAEEKKNLEKARKRLQRAEEKLELVRRWTPVVLQQFRETCVRLVRFREIIDVDCPRAIARIEQMLTALENYQTVTSPSSTNTSGTSTAVKSVARQPDDSDGEPSTEESIDS